MSDESLPKDNSIQSLGGQSRAQQLTPEERSAIASKAARVRWRHHQPKVDARAAEREKIPYAVARGDLHWGEIVIPCAVLDNGTRVLTERGLGDTFGRQRGGQDWRTARISAKGGRLPYFLGAKRLKSFLDNDLALVEYRPIPFRGLRENTRGGRIAFGVNALLIPNICDLFIKAKEAGALTKVQVHIAERAQLILRALANTGIIALVDEATGYQYIRERDELQKILAKYIAPELLPWTKRFPDDFYREMFRLWSWPWPIAEDSHGPLGPRYAGKLTKKLVYERLPPGVLKEIEKRNPPNAKWQRKNRHHQHLSEDIGHPHLEKQVAVATTIMKICDDKDEFFAKFEKAFPGTFPQGRTAFI